ncbi:MAG TPA: translation initiation factor IF-2 N-terminal domain-containing protein, partial [Chloroflexota bacterium]|nr:translation initiation factor IF-2 N-terminal domain-containing protein [Chloroflexota bacterium]
MSDLATLLGLPAPQIIKTLLTNGTFATINQALDYDTAAVVATDLGFEVREQGSAAAATAPAPARAMRSSSVAMRFGSRRSAMGRTGTSSFKR